MYRILEFLRSIYLFLLFVALEIGAICFYANSDSYVEARILGYTSSAVGSMGSATNAVKEYFTLRKTNLELMSRIGELEMKLAGYREMLSDSLLSAHSYVDNNNISYKAAKVVSRTINRSRNHIIINRGLHDGIRAGMAVVSTDNQLLGVVTNCSDGYSVVMSALSVDFKTSGQLLGSTYAGGVYWAGIDRYRLKMKELSKYANINIGDFIVTTGFSKIFPPDVLIGEVASFNLDPISQTYNVDIELAADMSAIDEVLVVNYNTFASGRDMIIEIGDDDVISMPYED